MRQSLTGDKLLNGQVTKSDLLLLVTWRPVLLYALKECSVSRMCVRRGQMCKQKQKKGSLVLIFFLVLGDTDTGKMQSL